MELVSSRAVDLAFRYHSNDVSLLRSSISILKELSSIASDSSFRTHFEYLPFGIMPQFGWMHECGW